MLLSLILIPLLCLIVLNLPFLGGLRRAGFSVALLLSLAQATMLGYLLASGQKAGDTASPAPWVNVFDAFHLTLEATNLSLILLLSAGIVLFATLMVARYTVEPGRQPNFVSMILLAMCGMNAVVLVTDIFSLYVFIEVVSVASFVLIAFDREKNGLEGALKYLILSAVATMLMLSAIAIILMVAGTTSFDGVRDALAGAAQGTPLVRLAMGAFICGLFIKSGVVPFHGWLPAAYSAAPSAASVFLAGVGTKIGGIYALIRLFHDVLPASETLSQVVMAVGALSIVVGALAALGQKDIKRLLAYSSISQVGYIILALGAFGSTQKVIQGMDITAGQLAFAGALLHMFNHAIFKSLLFVNAAALQQRLGTTDMMRMQGLNSNMPITSATNMIAALSTAGVPPLAGFWSKLLIVIALWTGDHCIYAAVAVLFSVVTLGYLLMMTRRVFFGKPAEALAGVREASYGLVLPAIVLAAITIGVGVLIPSVFNTFLLAISRIL